MVFLYTERILKMRRRTVLKSSALVALGALGSLGLNSCNNGTSKNTSRDSDSGKAPLKVSLVPWLGWGRTKIAEEKGFFEAEGVIVEHQVFQTVGEVDTTLLSGKADLAWIAAADLIILSEKTPGLKFIMACDYSGAVDAIIGKGIKNADDAKGKKFAREDVPYEIVFVSKYLKSLGLSEVDVDIVPLAAADGSAALIAGQVDAAAVYEPFITNARKESDEIEVLFTAEDTNVIINGLAGQEMVLNDRRDDILAYMRAMEKAMVFAQENPEEAHQIIGDWVGLSGEETGELMKQIVLLDLDENKAVAFNNENELNVANSIRDAGPILVNAGKTKAAPDASSLVDGSFVAAL